MNHFAFEINPDLNAHLVKTTDDTTRFCDLMLHDAKLMTNLKQLNFDLALVDLLLLGQCVALVPYTLGIPFVGQSTAIMRWSVGVPYLCSFMPFILQETDYHMTFGQKLECLIMMGVFNSPLSLTELNRELLQEFAPQIGSWRQLTQQAELYIKLRDHIIDYPAPSMPNIVTTAAITYRPAKPLPKALADRIKSAKPIILMSFGSTTDAMPKSIIDVFANAFTQLPEYTIVWRLASTENLVLSDNVVATPWLPQNDLLGLNETKLFITHCGSNGMHEALYHNVPMVGFPLLNEQAHNAFNLEAKNYGVRLNIKTVTTDELVRAIRRVLRSNEIKDKVAKISQILKERPLPAKIIVDKLEHVMKYGSKHLRPASVDMPLYELYMLDVFAVLLGVVILLGWIIYVLLKCCCRALCRNASTKSKAD